MLFGSAAFAQVENGSFEEWIDVELFDQPAMSVEAISSNHEIFIDAGEANVTRVQNGNESLLRLENIEVDQEVYPAFYILGNTPSQDGENLVFEGGIPASDPNISGVSVDMAYDFPSESSGFVIVQVKNDGTPVGEGTMGTGTFFFPLSGEKTMGNEVFDFGAPLGIQFDQIVIGFATADLVSDDENYTSGAWMEIDNLAFEGGSDIIENGDFEIWEELPAVVSPVYVDVELNLVNPKFERSTDASAGQYAIELKTTAEFDQAEATLAMIGSSYVDDTPVVELVESHGALSFDYKYEAIQDQAEVELTFFQSNGETPTPVFTTTIDLLPTESYQTVMVEYKQLLLENSIEADMVAIKFFSSKEMDGISEESVLTIDNLQTSLVLNSSFTRPVQFEPITAYPNPTRGRVTFSFPYRSTGFYRVYNIQGFLLQTVDYENAIRLTHNLIGQPAGQYTFRFYDRLGVRTVRVVKN